MWVFYCSKVSFMSSIDFKVVATSNNTFNLGLEFVVPMLLLFSTMAFAIPGNSANQAIELLIQKGVPESHIIFLNLTSAPEGIHCVCKRFPSLKIVTSEIDVALNEEFRVIPGMEYWWTYMRADSEVLDEVRRLSEAGKIKIPVEKTFPIAQLEIQEAKEKLDGKDADYEAVMSYKLSIAKKVFSQEKDMILNSNEGWDLTMSATYLLQTVSRIPSILELHLPNCRISDPPLTLPFLNFTSLSMLDLSNNGFKSTILDWLFNLKSLVKLDLSNSHFHGEIPDAISNLAFLEKLDLSGIHWGKLSRNLGKLCNLELYDSKISGEIVDSFDSLSECFSNRLETLDLGDNGFFEPIPGYIGEAMPLLSTLDILLSIGNLSKLIALFISNNKLSGQVPQFWENLPFLEFIDTSNNSLSGTIPRSIGSLSHLQYLSIPSNNFFGELPFVTNCSKMVNIDLSYNKFSGKLPVWIGIMSSLLILRLKANFFTGNIPSQLCSLSNLHILDISHNNVSGHIPHCIGNLSGMKSESISMKKVLSNNKLSGELPSSLKNYTSLASLDLGDKNFYGKLPSWIGETMPNILILHMRANFFTGDIPSTFCSLANLHILDLSYNSLSDHILDCIGNLSAMIFELVDFDTALVNGRKILTANQFQTLDDPSIYQGNVGLCGKPLPTDCTGSIIDTPGEKEEEDGDVGDPVIEQLGFFISIFMGFLCGILGCL
ncbi:hypothetical protein FEM48_Zijuj09G0217500 [Ziziphus jujuba var. spinosa]|uniref:Uncharacterized protein n=1 Tax=Ziziphus jujuba var. spinosa TaxID=714518 RepID=A0A978UVH5_ZIZJJ|nr:hypothetical protein FEM48_Zijuj09G0217500 [Ziziphus jujuba var. spinosa]